MNKQELIEKIKKMDSYMFNFRPHINETQVLNYIRQLDEPQKPVVPQFVGDYIKYAIENDWDFQDLFKYIEDEEDEELLRWVYHERNQETLAAAWINGYTVEEEKRYTIRLKNTDDYLVKTNNDDYRFYNNIYTNRRKHTRKEIEKSGFGWVFDCRELK